MTTPTSELLTRWREIGPAAWAEGPGGWIGEDGQPIILEPWQRAVLEAWWEHREDVTTLGISNVKKSGKTLLDAVLLAWRWLALPGLHFAAANSLDQASARQFEQISEMVQRHPFLRTSVESARTRLVFAPTGSRLDALPADATSIAGANFLTASHTEAWGILYEGDRRCWEELTPPPGRFNGLPVLRVADSYAGLLGMSETWHQLVDRGLEGERISEDWPLFKAEGLLLFHMVGEAARVRCFRGTDAEREAYYSEQRRTLRPSTFRRFHDNERTAGESAFVSQEAWDALEDPELEPLRVADPKDTRKVYLAVDASTSKDTTAAVGVTTGGGLPAAVYVRVWTPKRGLLRGGKPTVDLAKVDKAVRALHEAKKLAVVAYDPFQLHSIALGWERDGLPVREFPQGTLRLTSDTALFDAIQNGGLVHTGDKTLTEHVMSAAMKDTPRGLRIVKQPGSKPIDACVALSMALYLSGETRQGVATSVPNVFYQWHGADLERDFVYDSEGHWTYAKDHGTSGPMPAGHDWRTCRRRRHGCQWCITQMEQEGIFEKDRREAELIRQAGSPEPYTGSMARTGPTAEEMDHVRRTLQFLDERVARRLAGDK